VESLLSLATKHPLLCVDKTLATRNVSFALLAQPALFAATSPNLPKQFDALNSRMLLAG
jgi:hypothetical protein